VKRGLSCSYEQSKPTGTPDSSNNVRSPPSNAHTPSHLSPDTGGEPHAGLNRHEELCLVHHYTTSTHMGISRHDRDSGVWQNMPFYDGMTYPFVLDAVLAVAALHKAFIEPQNNEKYISACLFYQNQCLQTYYKQLTNINPDNCHAMFAVSALINVLTIAMSRGSSSLVATSPLETLFTTFKLLRGIQVVLHGKYDIVRSAHYKEIFSVPEVPPDSVVSPEVSHAMKELLRLVTDENNEADPDRIEMYKSSIDSLEKHFREVEQVQNFGAIISWPLSLHKTATELLKSRDPMMMLIFVHYGVLYLHIHERWWAHNFGCRLIWELSESLHALGGSWLPLTSWARSKAANVRATPPAH
jgi:hypothetical protein